MEEPKQEWIVTLHRKEDLEDFYNDMETPGGNLYIPDREVEVSKRRTISRNTHYMLTRSEVELVKADDRVWDVELAELIDITTRPSYKIENGEFSKSWAGDADDINWGLLRQSESSNRSGWGDGGTTQVISDLTITSSGKHVDVIIVDGHIDPDHPEFAVNPDGSGGSRVVQYNWFQNDIGSGTGTYQYDRSGSYTNAIDAVDNDHGCHCGGTVAGNTQGWARDANVYNISPYSSNPNWTTLGFSSSTYWDYMRAWHNAKPINPATGRKNPTVTNNSYGSGITPGNNNFGNVTRVNYRGMDFAPGRDCTLAELNTRGFGNDSLVDYAFPNYFTSRQADIQDAIDDGIIIVASAGNDYWKICTPTDQDYNNVCYLTYFGFNYNFYYNRGTGSGAGYAPVIVVGATSNDSNEDKASFSNCGDQVDVYGAGEAIQSSIHTPSGQVGSSRTDPRDSSYYLGKYQGTSMSGPQIAGILALLAESWPNMTQAEAHAWIINNANENQMFDSGADDPTDWQSLRGGANLFARWINQRPESGTSYPQKNFRPRASSGRVYPRPRIRRRG
jgi:hypothetical protein